MSKMNMAINALRKETVVGFDSETKPAFARGKLNKVALLQVSTFSECYLFRINKIGIPDKLKSFLEDKNIKKIGLSLNNDIIGLKRITDINPEGFIDLQKRVNEYAIADMSLQRIYAIIFGKKISKSQRLTNWEAPTLTTAQQKYAALDAFSCLEIYDHLNKGLFVPENSPYILHEIDNDNETEKI